MAPDDDNVVALLLRRGEFDLSDPTIFCQKQKLCCRASAACFEACASTISTRLEPGRIVNFNLRSRDETASNASRSC